MTKNNSDTTKSYMDRKDKARINELMDSFEKDMLNEPEEQPKIIPMITEDEFDIEEIKVDYEKKTKQGDYKTYMNKILSNDNPNESQGNDMDILKKENEEDVIVTKAVLSDESDLVVQVEECLAVKPEEKTTEADKVQTDKYNECANIDNDYIRPMKEASEKIAVPSNKKAADKKQSTLAFTPKAARAYAKIRKKYKINKDNIFSENDYVDGFILAKGEMLLRRYDALKVNGGNVGRILVTNKRMLFNTSEKAEIPIDSVCGIRSAKYWKISWTKFVFSLIFFGIAAFTFLYDFTNFDFFEGKNWLIYIIIAVGGILAFIGLIFLLTFARRRFALKIFVKSALEYITYNSKKSKKESAVMQSLILAMPGKHIDKFVREVGALILQSREGYFDN